MRVRQDCGPTIPLTFSVHTSRITTSSDPLDVSGMLTKWTARLIRLSVVANNYTEVEASFSHYIAEGNPDNPVVKAMIEVLE